MKATERGDRSCARGSTYGLEKVKIIPFHRKIAIINNHFFIVFDKIKYRLAGIDRSANNLFICYGNYLMFLSDVGEDLPHRCFLEMFFITDKDKFIIWGEKVDDMFNHRPAINLDEGLRTVERSIVIALAFSRHGYDDFHVDHNSGFLVRTASIVIPFAPSFFLYAAI